MFPLPQRRRRSALYLPTTNARAVEKARTLPCDVVILDLEDAVTPERKAEARASAVAAVAGRLYGEREVAVRVNAPQSEAGRADIAALVQARPSALLLPKIESPADITSAAPAVSGSGVALWAMVETTAAVVGLGAIAALAREMPLEAFVMGGNDLAKELGVPRGGGRAPLDFARGMAVIAARANGIDVLDGVFNDIADSEGFAASCRQAADDGFSGKTLIHPSQIAPCNDAFRPPQSEIEWAQGVVVAFNLPENAGAGAIRFDGEMVERLHLDIARRVLSRA